MSFSSSSRPTLPPIRDIFREEFSSKVNPPSNSPSFTLARPWSGDYQETRSLPSQLYPDRVAHSIYGVARPLFSDAQLRGKPPCIHNHQLSDKRMVSVLQSGLPSNSSLAGSEHSHYQVLSQNLPFSTEPPYSRSTSDTPSTVTENAETFERSTPLECSISDDDPSLASTHPRSFTHGVQHERRNSSAIYECPYCGKMFNRPSSLKVHSNSHTGEKPFPCPVEDCGRSFSVLSNMRRHARVHSSHVVPLKGSASDFPFLLSST